MNPASFRIHALSAAPYAVLHQLDDAALRAHGAARVVADGRPAYPCRVSLQDAQAGERLILVPYAHQTADTPYRASGPIYVRAAAQQARPAAGEVPLLLRSRQLSVRAYTAEHWMAAAEVCAGSAAEACFAALLDDARIAYLHVHYAKPGCYACRVEREPQS